MGIKEVLTAPQSPWQNPYAERLIGSIRRECLNHFVILSARHLRHTLAKYFNYYHWSRPHLGLDKQCPSRVRSRLPDASFGFRNSVVYTIVMNVSPRDLGPGGRFGERQYRSDVV